MAEPRYARWEVEQNEPGERKGPGFVGSGKPGLRSTHFVLIAAGSPWSIRSRRGEWYHHSFKNK